MQNLPQATCKVIDERLSLPERAYHKARFQYRSSFILATVQAYASRIERFNRILGVVNVDLFARGLNFVFGEAVYSGKSALISLWRLRAEFYGNLPDPQILAERSLKESIHEIGHTLGLKHCPLSSCVMHFSNSIYDTDRKRSLFCHDCYSEIMIAINNLK